MNKQDRRSTMELIGDQIRNKLNTHVELRKTQGSDTVAYSPVELAIIGIYLALDELAMNGINVDGVVETTEV